MDRTALRRPPFSDSTLVPVPRSHATGLLPALAERIGSR